MRYVTRNRKRILAVFMAFSFIFTAFPAFTGEVSYAATAKKPAKVTGVKKVTATTTSIKIKWNRIPKNKNTKGYVVYRNGKIIKSGKKVVRMGKNTLNYTDKKLKANTTYKYRVRAYNTYKQKQYYNSKKKKWQNSKPKKKHWKGKRTRKVTKYRYGAYSAEVKIKTTAPKTAAKPATSTSTSSTSSSNTSNTSGSSSSTSGSSGSSSSGSTSQSQSSTSARLAECPNRYTIYNGVKVYCGQDFTTSLLNQLKAASDGGYKKVTRPRSNEFPEGKVVNMDIHFFGINTYDPFLAVYVINNQVRSISTNSQEMFNFDGRSVYRGNREEDWIHNTAYISATPNSKGASSGILIGTISTTDSTPSTNNWSPEVEREVAFYFTNAVRVAGGSTILKRSYYLEGAGPSGKSWAPGVVRLSNGNLVYSGTASNGKTYKNQRFGAQAWAESMYEYGRITHDIMDVGPHANVSQSTIINCIYRGLTGKAHGSVGDNVNTSSAGDSGLFLYGSSAEHWVTLMDRDMVSLGWGFYHGKSAMFLSPKELD